MNAGNAHTARTAVFCFWAVLVAGDCLFAQAPAAESEKTTSVSNLWVDTEIRLVMQDISSQTGIAIICDQTVQGVVTLSVKDMSVEECLERVCSVGGYSYVKIKDYYVVGRPDPGSPIFQWVAAPQRIKLTYSNCDQVKSMLPASLAQHVTYDKPGGAVLVTAPELARQSVLEAIKLIDQPNQQIAIEAVVFELSEDGAKQLGLDWQYKKTNLSVGGRNLVGTITFDAGSELATFIDVTLRAIVQNRNGQVLANPRILVMNGQEADIFVGQEKYFSLLSGQAMNPYYRLESIKAGVTLKVAPQIGDNGHIVLQLEPEVSDVVTENNRDSTNGTGGNFNSPLPVVSRRRAKTVISVKDGQTIIIGGLLREQHRASVEKVPLMGDMPGIGLAFRNVQERKEQQEVVILITAHLVNQNQPSATEVAPRLEQRYISPLDAITVPVQGAVSCASRK
jgi:type IV pilus assembly protein PilQ